MGYRRESLGVAIIVALAMACLGVSAAGGAERVERKVSCSLQAGTLEVTSNGPDTVLTKQGDRIVVSDFFDERTCDGGDPTMDNVDTIVVGSTDRAILDMREGLFAPGATPEADGTSEIEIQIAFGSLNSVDVKLGQGAQKVRLGALADGSAGVNLNAQDEAGGADADVITRPGRGFESKIALTVTTGIGRDRLNGRGGQGFDGPWPSNVALRGGGGDDRVVGPHRYFNLLTGGPGDDRIRGGRKLDLIAGGADRDSISAGRGPDLINIRDGARDDLDCGRGRDSFAADRNDTTRRCEEDFSRKGRQRLAEALRAFG